MLSLAVAFGWQTGLCVSLLSRPSGIPGVLHGRVRSVRHAHHVGARAENTLLPERTIALVSSVIYLNRKSRFGTPLRPSPAAVPGMQIRE
jgi:hypothetical protein